MSQVATEAFVGGVIGGGYLIVALFFLRFWGRTRDRLFLAFAVAFALLAVGQGATVLLGRPLEEGRADVYLPRLAAFTLIIIAVVRKNVRSRRLPAGD